MTNDDDAHPGGDAGAAGLSEEPPPDIVLLRAERCRHQPESFPPLGLMRVRFLMRSGAWRYETVPVDAVVG